MSRRGLLMAAGLAVGTVTVATVGQTVPWLQGLAILAPGRPSDGPHGLPINKTARDAGIRDEDTGASYRLIVAGPRLLSLQLSELRAMPQRQVSLPIACVEGWSANALWEGIRLSDLLDAAGIAADATIQIVSLQKSGGYATSTMTPAFARDTTTLLALRVNNETLQPDHGYPARIIAPNRPGVLQTKWVTHLEAL